MRKILSALIVEGTLLSVVTDGREMILIRPSFSAADKTPRTSFPKYPNRKPEFGTTSELPIPCAEPANGEPAKNRELAMTRPLLKRLSSSMPRARENVGLVSTRLDSIKIWEVRKSSLPINTPTSSTDF
ncbi:MAG TPA: hypothetical protein VF130_05750, partial [Candidatus Binatia bacterium]